MGVAEGTVHYAYGAGSRMCAGSHLANRELYTAFLRLILAFKILPSKRVEDRPVMDALDCSLIKSGLTTDPKDFKLKMVCRDRELLETWLKRAE